MNLMTLIKDFFIYDANREFYTKVFPDSVPPIDLMRLRKMNTNDLSAVLAIEVQNYQFPWNKNLFKDCFMAMNYSCWVSELEENIIGYAILSIGAGEAHILNLSIDPTMQGKGIGQKIMEHLITLARKKADTLFLEVRPSNDRAIKLYHHLGFNEVGLRKNYYPTVQGREDALILALELVSL